jgi:hypothetical protein
VEHRIGDRRIVRLTWGEITCLANDWLPQPRILHPWPQARFAVTHPRWEPYAGIPLVRGGRSEMSVPTANVQMAP